MAKVMTVTEAVKTYIKDGSTITFGGFIGSAHPEEVSLTIEQEFLENGSPNNLTLLYCYIVQVWVMERKKDLTI